MGGGQLALEGMWRVDAGDVIICIFVVEISMRVTPSIPWLVFYPPPSLRQWASKLAL